MVETNTEATIDSDPKLDWHNFSHDAQFSVHCLLDLTSNNALNYENSMSRETVDEFLRKVDTSNAEFMFVRELRDNLLLWQKKLKETFKPGEVAPTDLPKTFKEYLDSIGEGI